MINTKTPTGTVEIEAQELKVLAKAKTIPFSIEGDGYEIDEEKRLKYKYIDLRRRRLLKNLETRHKIFSFIRDYLKQRDFIEIETPILTKSTPEGARDYLVPSRLQKGKFYALPQSPQQYKQLLMVAGIERYFQFPKCFRDEDPRADRQAEFTQLDIEMSFTDQEEILQLTEDLFSSMVREIFPKKKFTSPFPRMTYRQAMEKYKTDRPDLRKNKDELAFCFVLDFPMFEWHEKTKKWGAMHHPFTMPQTKNMDNPKDVLAYQYDLVLNGSEVGGGSLRTTDLDLLVEVFKVLGHSEKETKKRFKNYFEAFSYGVPPHGGIAPGMDRLIQELLGEPNIREVMAFPKTGDNRDLMMEAPSEVEKEQLKELHLK